MAHFQKKSVLFRVYLVSVFIRLTVRVRIANRLVACALRLAPCGRPSTPVGPAAVTVATYS